VHDVTLHLWIRAFGDSLFVMRALSAAIGTITIALVFGAARELFAASCANRDQPTGDRDGAAEGQNHTFDSQVESSDEHGQSCTGRYNASDGGTSHNPDEAAAIAALLFAINLIAIKYSREVRMYPIVMAAVAAQTWCFLRAYRGGRFRAYAGVAIFTALAVAAHLTGVLAFTGEGLWPIYGLAKRRYNSSTIEVRRALALLAALGAGAMMLAPFAPTVIGAAAHAADRGAIEWIKRPAPWAPFALFNKGTGSFAFPVMAVLGLWGCVRGWRRWNLAIVFALLWMWTPPLLLTLISYAIRPAFVERYLVSCFVPFFILVAIGIVELPGRAAQLGAIALVSALAIGHVVAWDRKPHDVQWREAVRSAITGAGNNGTLAVAPGYASNVVRYYLKGNSAAPIAHPADASGRDSATVVIIGEQGVAPATATALVREYPRVLAKLRGVVVRGR
jgi:4-amino-4-deoxy-L-arabinose transferase-like glycosyltransferase